MEDRRWKTEAGEIGVPQWHRDELDRRLADPSEQANVSWQDVQARLRRSSP
ncbi:MAG TPA: hypothetical protein VIK25_12750 [Gemmatimonadaceae bacterium]